MPLKVYDGPGARYGTELTDGTLNAPRVTADLPVTTRCDRAENSTDCARTARVAMRVDMFSSAQVTPTQAYATLQQEHATEAACT